LAEKGNFVAVG